MLILSGDRVRAARVFRGVPLFMKPFASRFAVIITPALILAGPNIVRAQDVGVSMITLHADHQLLEGPLTGFGAKLSVPRGDGHVAFRLGVERFSGRADSFGIACAGPTAATCPGEPIQDVARITSADAGAMIRLLGGERFAVAFTADLTVASVRVDTRGLTSGRVLPAKNTLLGPSLGLEADWSPLPLPVALEIEGGVGGLNPVASGELMDGYAPFNSGFGTNRIRIGITWRTNARRF